MNEDMQVVINFYKKFDRYKDNTDEEIYQHILPSFQLKQYKIHKDGENVIAFTNWAFLSKEIENRYVETAELNSEDWNSGDRLWHIDTLCMGNILKYAQRYGKKDGKNRNDLMKVIHYGIIQLYQDHYIKENNNENK